MTACPSAEAEAALEVLLELLLLLKLLLLLLVSGVVSVDEAEDSIEPDPLNLFRDAILLLVDGVMRLLLLFELLTEKKIFLGVLGVFGALGGGGGGIPPLLWLLLIEDDDEAPMVVVAVSSVDAVLNLA